MHSLGVACYSVSLGPGNKLQEAEPLFPLETHGGRSGPERGSERTGSPLALDFFGLFILPGSEFVWGLVLGIVPEIVVGMVLWNKRLRKALRKDVREQLLSDVDEGLLDPAISRATAGVETHIQEIKDLVQAEDLQAQVAQVHGRLEELDQALEARLDALSIDPVQEKLRELDEALGAHLTALHEGLQDLPARVRSSLAGSQGAEMKEVYKAVEAAETTAIEMYEAELSPEERLAARIDQMEPSDDWKRKHEVGNMIVAGVKEFVRDQILARRGDVVNMRRVGSGEGKFPTVYGK